eukprot:NODE_1396_length_1153_cov_378.827869.p1 GENE.NODE_1396_length_1153_cov_378.827869~~NODE_1396_length_1153_cov_378.827869.p1  ORF type:complete len:345 (-),score=88.23 NODE_1396_length_1153_cov_378.827869:119-1033(-)
MLSRQVLRRGGPAIAPIASTQIRHAATLKEVKIRMRSVENIQKITKAMKMVAAAKFRRDQQRLEAAIPFAQPVIDLMQRLPEPAEDAQTGKKTVLAVSSDRGLCGGVNSAVCKATAIFVLKEEAQGNDVAIWTIGAKAIAGMKLKYGDHFGTNFEEVAKLPFTFGTASVIGNRVLGTNPESLVMTHNRFRTMGAYDTLTSYVFTNKEAMAIDRAEWSKALDVYTFEPSIYEVFDDLHDYYIGVLIFTMNLDATAAEQSSRMSAMENASKNATEMLDKLTLIYNRARQAKITTELCEIISGASAV